MDGKDKQTIIDEISKMVAEDRSFTINHKNKTLAIVLPIKDYQKFQSMQEARLIALKSELNCTLKLVRRYTGHESLAEVESRLAALRHTIEQETGK